MQHEHSGHHLSEHHHSEIRKKIESHHAHLSEWTLIPRVFGLFPLSAENQKGTPPLFGTFVAVLAFQKEGEIKLMNAEVLISHSEMDGAARLV